MLHHLRSLRIINNVEEGFDHFHSRDDPLWETEQVKRLIRGRPKFSEEEKRRVKSEYQREQYQKSKSERERLTACLESGEITQKEHDAEVAKWNVGWYRMLAEKKELVKDVSEIAKQMSLYRSRLYDCFYQEENPFQNPVAYVWPMSPSEYAYQQLICLCTPVHHLAKMSDPTTQTVQTTIKTVLSPNSDYLNLWLSPTKRISVVDIFSSCCDMINAKMSSMDWGETGRFLKDWEARRDRFLLSMTGNSKGIPPFVLLNLVALAWPLNNGENNSDEATGDLQMRTRRARIDMFVNGFGEEIG